MIDYEELARRIKRNEDGAFREFGALFGRHFRWRLMGWGLEEYQAEDLAATFITDISLLVADHFEERDEGGFKSWVLTTFRNKFYDHCRKQRLDTVPLEEDRPDLNLAAAVNHSQEGPAEAGSSLDPEEIQAVHDAWRRLTDDDRRILRIRDLRSAPPFAEIASELGISEGAARVRHLRALRKLSELVGRDPRLARPITLRTPARQEN